MDDIITNSDSYINIYHPKSLSRGTEEEGKDDGYGVVC